MRYISLFSGIEAASVAWRDLPGFEPVAFCEIDRFPSAVLAHRFPDVPNLGDICEVDWKEVIESYGAVDLVVGGSPCQSFSIAGGRESLDGESRLMFEYIRAVGEVRPTWFLWENVPGVLSTRDDAFGQLLAEMEELGYGMAWRTLDAQFFGVAQRRRRVFLVGCLGGGAASAAVLFEPESVCGNTQSSRQKREELTRAVEERAGSGGFKFHQGASAGSIGYVDEQSPTLTSDWHQPAVMAFDTTQITSPDNNAHPEFGKPCHTLNARAHVPTICLQTDHMGQNGGNTSVDICKTLDCASQIPIVCLQTNDDIAASLMARHDSSPCADRGQNVVFQSSVIGDCGLIRDSGDCTYARYRFEHNDRLYSYICCACGHQFTSGSGPIETAMDEDWYKITCPKCGSGRYINAKKVICVSDDQAHSAIDVEMSGSLKVGGGCAVNSAGTDYVNALCARDYKGIGNQDIGDGKLICQKITD